MKMLILQCPQCKHNMKYQGRTSVLGGKRKQCVYCGKSFAVKSNIISKTS